MDDASLIGSTLGDRYRLLERIGDGGMGQVFRAERLDTGQTVALKLLHAELSGVDQAVQRFEREAKVTTQLAHPNIVKVLEFGAWKGRLFLAMELLGGTSLARLIERDDAGGGGPLPPARTLAIIRPVLDALEYAHDRGVVHRDLKPENIMVIPPRGVLSRGSVKLLDFGIASLGDDGEAKGPKLTQLGLVLGTPSYMSPEQAVGQKADARSDLYSCGVILYEMLTGRRPFEADSSLEILSMHLNTPPRSLRAAAPDVRIPAALEGVVLRALAKQPEQRFQSARELRKALARAAHRRDGEAAISGMEKTILAGAAPVRARGRWIRLATIAVATAMLIGDHVRLRARGNTGRPTSSAGSDSARKARAPARTDEPTPGRERSRRSSLAAARESPQRSKQDAKQARAVSKRNPQ